jgi:hypothetical protein
LESTELTHQPAIPSHTTQNFAPLTPLLEIQRGETRRESSSFSKAIRERFNHYYNLEKRVRESMIAAGYQVAMFMEGKQFLTPNLFNRGQFLPYTPQSPSEREKRAMNITRFYVTNNLWKWQLSNPDVVAVPGVDTEQARESSQAADIITEHYERRFFPPSLTIQEALQGLTFGTYVWEVRYDDTQHSIATVQPVFGMKPVTLGDGWGQCGDCGKTGGASEFAPQVIDPFNPPQYTCPQCGGEAAVEPPASELMPSVVGTQTVQLGDLTANLKAFPECAWDYRFPVEDSSWFIHQRATSAAAIRSLLGNVRLPTGEGIDDFGLQIMAKLGWASGGGSGQHSQDQKKREIYKDPATVVEFSLGPDDIADIVLTNPEETVGGDVIPAGPLLATFPQGLTVQGVNGLRVITGVFTEHHKTNHKSGVWYSRVSSGAGQGLDDLVEVNKRYNANDSQILTFLRASSTPAMRVIKGLVAEESRGQYLGDPATNVFVNPMNLPEGMKMQDAMGPVFQPQSVPAQFFGYTYQNLNQMAQIVSHVTDFSGGLPGVNNKTATGAQITQSNSNALFTPPLQVKGEVRKRIAEITVELYRKHFPVDRPFPLQGKYGRQQYRMLNGANIVTDIRFEVVRDSELPRNSFTKREDLFAFFTMMGGATGYASLQQLDPELVANLRKAFNIELEDEPYNQSASLCQQRLTQLKQVAEIAPDPMLLTGLAVEPTLGQVVPIDTGVIDPPIAMEEPDHDLKAKWFSEWLDFDEGQKAGPVIRAAVILLIKYHFQLHGVQSGEVAFQQGAIQAAAETPMALGQAVGQAANNEINPVPDVNNDVPTPGGGGGKVTGRPRPKAK